MDAHRAVVIKNRNDPKPRWATPSLGRRRFAWRTRPAHADGPGTSAHRRAARRRAPRRCGLGNNAEAVAAKRAPRPKGHARGSRATDAHPQALEAVELRAARV